MLFQRKLKWVALVMVVVGCVSCVDTPYTAQFLSRVIPLIQLRKDPASVYKGSGNRYFVFTNTPRSTSFGSAFVMVGHLFNKEEICIPLDERSLWEPNETAITMHQHYSDRKNYSLSVDGVENNTIYWESGLTYFNLTDESGAVIGSYSDLNYCFATDQLAVGHHRADLGIITTSGEDRHDVWEFSIF